MPEMQPEHRRRAARLVYQPDHFLVVMAGIAAGIVILSAALVACTLL